MLELGTTLLYWILIWLGLTFVTLCHYPLFRRLLVHIDAYTSYKLLLLVVCAPAFLSTLLVVLLDTPLGLLFVFDHCHNNCSQHEQAANLPLALFGYISLFVLLLAGFIGLVSRQRKKRLLKTPLLLADRQPDNSFILPTQIPLAFSFGLLKPHTYLSSGLYNQLKQDQLNAVKLHEDHHCRRKDNLRKLIVSALLGGAHRLSKPLLSDLDLLTEIICDDHAAQQVGSLSVAEALLTMAKVKHQYRDASYFAGEHIEMRIQYLVAPATTRHLGQAATFIGIIGLAAVFLSLTHPVHRLLETAVY